MVNDIEVLDAPDQSYWMAAAYRIPDTPFASVKLGERGFKTIPINRMPPRSFFTNIRDDVAVKAGAPQSQFECELDSRQEYCRQGHRNFSRLTSTGSIERDRRDLHSGR
jgi:hypothetical protein